MAALVEVLNKFKLRKFQKCLELIKLIENNDNDIENLALENCELVCESLSYEEFRNISIKLQKNADHIATLNAKQIKEITRCLNKFCLASVTLSNVFNNEEPIKHYQNSPRNVSQKYINVLADTNRRLEHLRIVKIKIEEKNPDKIYEMQEQLYSFYEKVSSKQIICDSIPRQLQLTATFNFIFWLLFYNDFELTSDEAEEYLELVNNGLLRVLGRKVTSLNTSNASEKILTNLKFFKDMILIEHPKTGLLILELVIVVILYVVKIKRTLFRDFLQIVRLFMEESSRVINSITSANEFLQEKEEPLCLFKFSLGRTASLYSELDLKVADYLNILESVFLILLEDFKGSLSSLKKNANASVLSLWNYLVILNSYELENWDLCSGILIQMSSLVVQKNLKARFHIMQGKLSGVERNHKKALQQFESALMLSPNYPAVYYYIGQEYGKMGLIDLMVENFEKLVQVYKAEDLEDDFKPNFEAILLDWIHPVEEITETEAYYALAVSYGLNENFKSSAEIFEKILQSSNDERLNKNRSIVDLPNFLTVLHEASIINLLLGNLARAEQIVLDAIDRYVPRQSLGKRYLRNGLLCRDVEWLQKVIQQELLGNELESKEFSDETCYSEDLVFFFSQNVIALLILSEIQRIQEIEDYKMTLSNIFSMFSKYLALMQKKHEVEEDEKHALTVVKALAGKTCVKIASIQMAQGQDSDVEKMFQRALSCNKGDNDALYNYCKFLLKKGKNKEAVKLWNTFSKEKAILEVDYLQSFSLRYFLSDKISKRDLENIRGEIESTNDRFS